MTSHCQEIVKIYHMYVAQIGFCTRGSLSVAIFTPYFQRYNRPYMTTIPQTPSSTVYREFFALGKFWRKCRLEGVLNFHWVLFSLFQGLSMMMYSRVYFSLCLFLAISGRLRTRRKLNTHEKFTIYNNTYTTFIYNYNFAFSGSWNGRGEIPTLIKPTSKTLINARSVTKILCQWSLTYPGG